MKKVEEWVDRRLATYERAERRCASDARRRHLERPLYIGRRWVQDDDGVLVVNACSARRASLLHRNAAAPHGVTLRRRFRSPGPNATGSATRRSTAGSTTMRRQPRRLPTRGARARSRPRMRDIVATIQVDQYGLTARGPEPPLVIQGGPGRARPRSACTARRISSSRTETSFGACSSSGRTPCSWTTSRTSCRRSARTPSTSGRSRSSWRTPWSRSSDGPDVERLKADLRLAEVVRRAVELRSGAAARARRSARRRVRRGARGRGRGAARARAQSSGCRPRRASGSG